MINIQFSHVDKLEFTRNPGYALILFKQVLKYINNHPEGNYYFTYDIINKGSFVFIKLYDDLLHNRMFRWLTYIGTFKLDREEFDTLLGLYRVIGSNNISRYTKFEIKQHLCDLIFDKVFNRFEI